MGSRPLLASTASGFTRTCGHRERCSPYSPRSRLRSCSRNPRSCRSSAREDGLWVRAHPASRPGQALRGIRGSGTLVSWSEHSFQNKKAVGGSSKSLPPRPTIQDVPFKAQPSVRQPKMLYPSPSWMRGFPHLGQTGSGSGLS